MADPLHGLGGMVYEASRCDHGHGDAVFYWLHHAGAFIAARLYSARQQFANPGLC